MHIAIIALLCLCTNDYVATYVYTVVTTYMLQSGYFEDKKLLG